MQSGVKLMRQLTLMPPLFQAIREDLPPTSRLRLLTTPSTFRTLMTPVVYFISVCSAYTPCVWPVPQATPWIYATIRAMG
jgi:hypothetical protein